MWLLLSATSHLKPRTSVISDVPQQSLHVVEMFTTAAADWHAIYTEGFTAQGADLYQCMLASLGVFARTVLAH